MQTSINYWNFKGGLDGTLGAKDFVDQAKKLGFDAVEHTLEMKGDISLDVTEKNAREIADYTRKRGLDIAALATGLYWQFSLTDPCAAVRKKAEAVLKKQIDVASWMKVGHILVVPGAVDVFFMPKSKPVPYDFVDKMARAAIKKAARYAEKKRVKICVENVWNKYLLSPLEMRDFVDYFDSPAVKVYFDLGNVIPWGYPEQWIRILKNRIGRVHVKDFDAKIGTAAGFCELLKGSVNFRECMKALREIGYKGPLTAEILPWAAGRPERTGRAMAKIVKM